MAVFVDANRRQDLVVSSLLARSNRRGCVTAFAMVAAVVALSGCSVEVAGVTGVGLDANGDLVGFIQMCDHHVVGQRSTEAMTTSSAGGKRTSESPTSSWSLSDPGRGRTAERRYSTPSGTERYSLYGWTADNSWSTEHVTFRLSDLDGMQPGEVMYWNGELTVATESAFRAIARTSRTARWHAAVRRSLADESPPSVCPSGERLSRVLTRGGDNHSNCRIPVLSKSALKLNVRDLPVVHATEQAQHVQTIVECHRDLLAGVRSGVVAEPFNDRCISRKFIVSTTGVDRTACHDSQAPSRPAPELPDLRLR